MRTDDLILACKLDLSPSEDEHYGHTANKADEHSLTCAQAQTNGQWVELRILVAVEHRHVIGRNLLAEKPADKSAESSSNGRANPCKEESLPTVHNSFTRRIVK